MYRVTVHDRNGNTYHHTHDTLAAAYECYHKAKENGAVIGAVLEAGMWHWMTGFAANSCELWDDMPTVPLRGEEARP